MFKKKFRSAVVIILTCVVLIALLNAIPAKSQGTLVVNKLADTNDGSCDLGDCSLREAIAVAPVGATITFAPSLTGTIVLGSELLVDTDLTISGPGANVITLSGNDTVRVLHTTATVNISGLTVAHGQITTDSGGGVFNDRGTLTMTNMVLSQNNAQSGG